MIRQLFADLGINVDFLVAGLIGGIIALTRESQVTIRKALISISTAGVTAVYLMPFLSSHLNIGIHLQTFLSFVLGLRSNVLIDFIYKYVDLLLKNKLKETEKEIQSDDEK